MKCGHAVEQFTLSLCPRNCRLLGQFRMFASVNDEEDMTASYLAGQADAGAGQGLDVPLISATPNLKHQVLVVGVVKM